MFSLTSKGVEGIIDDVLLNDKDVVSSLRGFGLRAWRATTNSDWRIISGDKATKHAPGDGTQPMHFGLLFSSESSESLNSGPPFFVALYIAYSTWDGRFLYIDTMRFSESEPSERFLLWISSKIASRAKCARLTWRHKDVPSWYQEAPAKPETLHGWLTLSMEKDAMISYGGKATQDFGNTFNQKVVKTAVRVCLDTINSGGGQFHLRLATRDDTQHMRRLVQGLADFEKEPNAVNTTEEHFLTDGWASEPLFYCLLLSDKSGDASLGYTCGMAFCYFGFSVNGRFLYLDDLFIESDYRKKGAGSTVMKSLCLIGLSLNCSRLHWQALDWNSPALAFYEKIGARVMNGVLTTRFAGSSLEELSRSGADKAFR